MGFICSYIAYSRYVKMLMAASIPEETLALHLVSAASGQFEKCIGSLGLWVPNIVTKAMESASPIHSDQAENIGRIFHDGMRSNLHPKKRPCGRNHDWDDWVLGGSSSYL